ncbi:MAG TPA: hypothetical protein VJ302_28045 [Blastocatellia bacterium]|nr:hypothetical protein [Blastocatellia bacterium]
MMKGEYRASPYWNTADRSYRPPIYPRDRHFGSRLLLVLLSTCDMALIANGLKPLTTILYPACFLLAGGLYVVRQSLYELSENGGGKIWFLGTLIVSATLAAYGFYGLNVEVAEVSAAQSSSRNRAPGTRPRIDDDSRISRDQIEARIYELENRLYWQRQLEATPARNLKIVVYQDRVRRLRERLGLSSPLEPSQILSHRLESLARPNDEANKQPALEPEHRSSSANPEQPDPAAPGRPPTPGNRFEEFVNATFARSTNAVISWALIIILEVTILIMSRSRKNR